VPGVWVRGFGVESWSLGGRLGGGGVGGFGVGGVCFFCLWGLVVLPYGLGVFFWSVLSLWALF